MSYYTPQPSRQERPQHSYEHLLGYGKQDPRDYTHARYTSPPLDPYVDAYDARKAEDRELEDLVSCMYGLSMQDRTYALLYAHCAHCFPNIMTTLPVSKFAKATSSSTATFSLQAPTTPTATPARQLWNAPTTAAAFGHPYPSPSTASPDEYALLELIKGVSESRMSSDHEVIDYYECFVDLSWPVYISHPTPKQDRDMWFWHGFHPKDRKALFHHLMAKYPNQPQGVFFDYHDVCDAGCTVFYRCRSWEHLLEQDQDPHVWDSDNDEWEHSWLPYHNQQFGHTMLLPPTPRPAVPAHDQPPHVELQTVNTSQIEEVTQTRILQVTGATITSPMCQSPVTPSVAHLNELTQTPLVCDTLPTPPSATHPSVTVPTSLPRDPLLCSSSRPVTPLLCNAQSIPSSPICLSPACITLPTPLPATCPNVIMPTPLPHDSPPRPLSEPTTPLPCNAPSVSLSAHATIANKVKFTCMPRPKGPRIPHSASSAISQPSTLTATSTCSPLILPPPPSSLDLTANLPPPRDSLVLLPSPLAASLPSPLATSLSSPVTASLPLPPAVSLLLPSAAPLPCLPCLPNTVPKNRLEEEHPKITKIDNQDITSAKKQQQQLQAQGPRKRTKRRRQTQQNHISYLQHRLPLHQQCRHLVHARALAHSCHWHLELRRPHRCSSSSNLFHIAKARLTRDSQFLTPQQV
ncbi:hypothetical protein BC827DRAFT_1274593 [Russula dissimulans]|nr:hypothetical protein BC827DRAFT_1274593 [Russula dissimulans]